MSAARAFLRENVRLRTVIQLTIKNPIQFNQIDASNTLGTVTFSKFNSLRKTVPH